MRLVPLALTLVLGALMSAAPAAAQESAVVGGSELDAALEGHSQTVTAERATVSRVLGRPEVAAVAVDMGVDLDAAKGAVAGMQGAQLQRAAGVAAAIEQQLAGGQTFSINATTLIIILLLIVIVVLIAD